MDKDLSNQENSLTAKIDELVKTVGGMESDLSRDRTRIDDLYVLLTSIETRLKVIEQRMPRLENRAQDALQRVIEPFLQELTKKPVKRRTLIDFLKRKRG